jgi:glycosyltransferase involved in cell wall biosynthesis
MESTGKQAAMRKPGILIIVENLPVPFDTRVWQEATTLVAHGYDVSVICPKGRGYERPFEVIDDVHIYRHPLPREAHGPVRYIVEYGSALFWELLLATRVFVTRGFDVIHACNPPDMIFVVGGLFKLLFGTRFVFDHHDLCPELYEAKFGRRDLLYHALLACERLTFCVADMSIATNDSYRRIAIERGGMHPDRIFVVRSGPDLKRIRPVQPNDALKRGRRYLVGYIGVMGVQEGLHYLIEAACHIVHRLHRHDIHFGLVGDGPERQELQDRCTELGLKEYFTFAGRVSDAMLLEMICTADVCINSDVVNPMNDKSTMNKIMEYMAVSKPIVQFDVTEGRFSAQDASVYARPNDPIDLAHKIVDLLDDPQRRQSMGEYGRRRVESDLAWHHQAPLLLSGYERLMKPSAAASGRQARRFRSRA